jgi:hypothetical protein
MAMRYLFQRESSSSSTDRSHMALIDHPSIKVKVDNVLKHMVLGKALANPLPFTRANGDTFVAPYILNNSDIVKQMEGHLGWFKQYLGMPQNGDANLIETILYQVKHAGEGFGDDIANTAYEANNYVTVFRTYGQVDIGSRFPNTHFFYNGRVSFQAGKENSLAYFMMDSVEKKPKFDEMGKGLVAPANLSDAEKLFFGIDFGFQYALINSAEAETDIPEAAFISTFGEENGKILRTLFIEAKEDKGKAIKAITAAKEKMMKEPAADASDNEKTLFAENMEVIKDFLDGAMSDEVFEFYKKQYEKLPGHMEYRNM